MSVASKLLDLLILNNIKSDCTRSLFPVISCSKIFTDSYPRSLMDWDRLLDTYSNEIILVSERRHPIKV